MKKPSFLSSAVLAILCGQSALAAVIYTGSPVTENFNSLTGSAAWTDNTTIPGWYAVDRTAGTSFTSYVSSTGSSAAAGMLLSLGDMEWALGSQTSNSGSTISYGLQLSNGTATVLTGFNIQYTGETWRVITNESADGIRFEYQIFAAGTGSLSVASGWNAISTLNYTSPVVASAGSTRVDGDLSANRTVLSGSATGVVWNSGDELWLRWTDVDSATKRAAVGIDDFSFTAVPEPAGAGLLGMAALGFFWRRRH